MTGIAALALSAGFTSCSSNGDDIEVYSQEQIRKAQFQTSFIKAFGNPASDHTWGFVDQKPVDLTGSATRGVNVNGNEWEYQPGAITEAELNAVKNFFNVEHRNYTNPPVHFTDFWIQQVYRSQQVYKDGYGQDVEGSAHMNKLGCKRADGTWEHSNNFNAANNFDWGGCTLMVSSGTESFCFSNSSDSGKDYETYIIKEINGNYYVGFDFYANGGNLNEQVARNYIFNDWIVKIVPASMTKAKMIIAEDLGVNESDFDYNDVIFEAAAANEYVQNVGNRLVAHVTLRAAGGTMPLYIGKKQEAYEVHNLFGVSTSTMVNTAQGKHNQYPVVQFTIDLGEADWNSTYNIKNIPVIVSTPNGDINLAVETGRCPEKIAVDLGFDWCDERQPIDEKYPNFPQYVLNPNFKWNR